MNTKLNTAFAAILGLSTSLANAELAFMGPTSPATGNFPTFYQDSTALALDLCLPNAFELANGLCLLLDADIPNPAAAISFPNNYPEEAFWWNATALQPVNGGNAVLVLGLEAAFGNGAVAVGDQIVFGRIRVRFVAPATGHYTVTHPYGIEEFDATAGERIFFSEDTGLNCGLDFSCAMRGRLGPFLRAADPITGAPLAPVEIPLASGKFYLSDPGLTTRVTDGPFGHVFRIEGPDIGGLGINSVETDQFSLMGRLAGALPSKTVPERATYTRNAAGTKIDVFASAFTALGQPAPTLQLTSEATPGTLMTRNPTAATQYYAYSVPFDPNVLPASVFVTNITDQPPSTAEINLTDEVTITQALYNSATHTLQIDAKSSDEVPAVPLAPPTLAAQGSDGTLYGPLAPGATVGSSTMTTGVLDVPPASVTVVSSAGGKATLLVTTTGGQIPPSALRAVDDIGVDASQPIDVLANDTVTTLPATVRIMRNPEHGTATVLADQTVQYSPTGTYSGPDTFTYAFEEAGGISNIASVGFDVIAQNRTPVAANDTASATLGGSVTVNVLANDSDPDGDPLTVTITNPPLAGSATVVNNQVVYTAPTTNSPTPQLIGYTISDGLLTASATVSVDLLPAEAINISKAQYTISKAQWNLEGTDTPAAAGVVINVYAGPTVGDPAKLIGTATTDVTGRWKLNISGSRVLPDATRTVSAQSSRGGVRLAFPHTVN